MTSNALVTNDIHPYSNNEFDDGRGNHTFGALGGGLSAAIASAVTRSPPGMVQH